MIITHFNNNIDVETVTLLRTGTTHSMENIFILGN